MDDRKRFQLRERERLVASKRASRSIIPKPKVKAPPKPSRPLMGVTKKKQETIRNEKGRVYAVQKKREVQTRASSCSKVYTAKQEGSICWFAAVFTTLFFSQNTRIVVKKHAQRLIRDPSSRDIALAMLEILKGYETGKVSKRVVNHMQPRQFLMDLRKARPEYFSAMQNGTDEAHYGTYQHAFFAFLKVPHLSIGVVNGKIVYSGFNKDLPLDHKLWPMSMKTLPTKGTYIDTNKPEVLIIHKDSGEDYLQNFWSSPVPEIGTVAGYSPNSHAKVIKYNGISYILDSCILGAEVRTQTCSIAHAIAGVTCNGERYVYNGWTAKSGDPAMAGSTSVISDMPCALGKYNWDKNKSFCINTGACRFQNARPNQIGRELCFNSVARSSVIYIRADIVRSVGYKKIGKMIKKK
ncbi:hypothetical protein PBCVNEJV1_886L [Paramecium bursaria Chlorella virus NE-JV-1]|nr:hypothetical protein PBCVNEJV1_886L [Paramecium bursaria Chlorella virus NE-JV-1]